MPFSDSPTILPDVTITVLDISLRLCTIPRSRLPETTHYVVKQFLRQSPTFMNITLNTSELSIFAEDSTLEDFLPLARRGRMGSRSTTAPVEISSDTWSVLQIDEDKFGDAGTRVCEISAALASAGVSILYQSSYMSDFILVKSSSLPSVIALLAHAGFGLYSTDAVALTSTMSPPLPALEERRMSIRGSLVLDGDVSSHGFGLVNVDDTFALPSPKRHRSTSSSSVQSISLPAGAYPFTSSIISPLSSLSTDSSDSERESEEPKPRPAKESPRTPPKVEAVAADLAVIGLSEEASDSWLSRMILLMLYPNMIATPWASPAGRSQAEELSEPETPAELENTTSPCDEEHHHVRSPSPTSPISPVGSTSSRGSSRRETASSTVKSSTTAPRSQQRSTSPPQPFFSFTRAKGECASVVADVRLLAALFPTPDRHMVLSAHELEGVDEIAMTCGDVKAAMRCLTIDLPHGLDTHGLVNHFSSTLHRNGINHLYSSTYKTANLLVDRQDADRAEALLRSC
ncbi:hypothetical protein BDV93DRAFT_555114 [Ceratobasidium sp. AG-I]|nr:hypothetical protein BDV93DRAFT_555114 [Ceratobasidium sp. AG-I]